MRMRMRRGRREKRKKRRIDAVYGKCEFTGVRGVFCIFVMMLDALGVKGV